MLPDGFGPRNESRAGYRNFILDLSSTGWTEAQMKRSDSEIRERRTQKHVQFFTQSGHCCCSTWMKTITTQHFSY